MPTMRPQPWESYTAGANAGDYGAGRRRGRSDGRPTPTQRPQRELLLTVDHLLNVRPRWHDLALCRGEGSSVFFSDDSVKVSTARAICAECPAREPCLAWAMKRDDDGMWGGLTREERRARRRDEARGSRPQVVRQPEEWLGGNHQEARDERYRRVVTLLETAPLSVTEIADLLGIKYQQVQCTIGQGLKRGTIFKVSRGVYASSSEEVELV